MTEQIKTDQLVHLPMGDIFADTAFNCRGEIAPIDVVDLAKDIQVNGLIQPIIVAPLEGNSDYKYRLIAGYRRYKAHIVAKMDKIKAIINPEMVDEKKARIFNLSENLQRKDLNILQEAKAIQRLVELGIPNETIANEISKSYGWVQVRAMLLKLPDPVQQEVSQGYIPQAQIRQLYSINNDSGEDACFTAVRKLKEAKERGQKKAAVNIRPRDAKQANVKRQRKRHEVIELMDQIQNVIGNGFFTRVLAWTAGEISDLDIYYDLKQEADKRNVPYHVPEWVTKGN